MRRPVNWFDSEAVDAYYTTLERERRLKKLQYIASEIAAGVGMIVLFCLACTLFLIGG